MVNGEDVKLAVADDSIHDAIGSKNDLANRRVGVLWHQSPGLWEVVKAVYRVEKAADHDSCVVWRVSFDEGVNRTQIRLSALGPVNRNHARKRFLTSS
jgi:hypothetical protein